MENESQKQTIRVDISKLPTRKAALIFTRGTNDSFKSRLDDMIVIAKKEMNIIPGRSYDCVLRPMIKENSNGFIVIEAKKTPPIKATLSFKTGKMGNMVSTFGYKIVIAPDNFQITPYKQYECDIVLSPNGNAYIVEDAKLIPEKVAKSKPVAHLFGLWMCIWMVMYATNLCLMLL